VRVIHDPRADETVVCRGTYQYLRQGKSTGLVEHWTVSRLPDGHEIVRADVDARAVPGATSLLTHFQRRPDGSHQWLRVRLERPGFSAAAQYDFDTAEVKVYRQSFGSSRQEDMVLIAENYVIDYHPVIAHDYVWRGYPAQAEGQPWSIPVFSPELWAADTDVLAGRALRFTVTPLSPEPCVTPAGDFECAMQFKILLSDGVLAVAWYDDDGIPLRWQYPDKGYDFVLVAYIRE
jgi:hypothetical protein